MEMAERQADVVNALLDTLERDDWSHAFVHCEFHDEGALPTQLEEGFLVIREAGGPKRADLLVESEVGQALRAMRESYTKAGHGFSRADLIVNVNGAYRFELGNEPSLRLAGQPDPGARERLERRFEALVRGEESAAS
jgi:hypothetical protein